MILIKRSRLFSYNFDNPSVCKRCGGYTTLCVPPGYDTGEEYLTQCQECDHESFWRNGEFLIK